MTLLTTIMLAVIALSLAALGLFISRNSSLVKKSGIGILVILILGFGYMFLNGNISLTVVNKTSEAFVMNVNETKSISGTQVKLNEVFSDLLNLNASYSVRGSKKVVAIELKKNPEDKDSLAAMPGLWIGGRIIPENSSFGMSYYNKANEFIDPVYIVFYLADGKSISFELKDKKGVKERVKVIDIEKEVKLENTSIKLSKLYKGLDYSMITYESEYIPTNLEFAIIDGDIEMSKGQSWSGGGNKYTGSIGFEPIKSDVLKIKLKDKISKKENTTEVKIK